MRNLPPLSALRAFEATARTGSVTRAAQELFRTHGAVSRQLRLLQEHAGVALFDKDGTGLALNQHGKALYEVARAAFEQLEQGYGRVLDQARGPTLHVACSATFAMRWLVPQLVDFYRMRPDIRIRLSMTSAREIRREGADLLVAWDLSLYPQADRARAVPLAPVRFGPVCAPALARKLRGAPRIAHDFTSSAWDQWEELAGKPLARGKTLAFPHTHLCIEAALSGLGVALIEQRLVRRELEEGRLAAPHGFIAFPQSLNAVPMEQQPTAGMAEFIAWLQGRLAWFDRQA